MPLIRATNRLWLPGQKPQGPVKIDASHPSANALNAYVLHGQRQGADYDLISGGYFPWSGRTVIPGADSITNLGTATRYGNTASSASSGPANFKLSVSSSPSDGLGDYTMACQVIFRVKSTTQYTEICGQSDVTVSTNTTDFFINGAGNIVFEDGTGFSATLLAAASLALDTPYTLFATRIGTSRFVYLNGVFIVSGSGPAQTIIGGAGGGGGAMFVRYGAWDTGFSAIQGNAFDILWSAGWNRALSADEIAAFTANPYGLLIPAEAELPAIAVVPPPNLGASGTQGINPQNWRLLPRTPGRLPDGVTRGLTNRWPLDAASFDNLARDIVGPYHGTFIQPLGFPNVPFRASGPVAGSISRAFGRDAAGSASENAVRLTAAPIPATGWTGSISFWVWLDGFNTATNDGDPRLICIGTTTDLLVSSNAANGTLNVRYGTGGVNEHIGGVLTLGQWHHVVATYPGGSSTLKVYLDGVDVTSPQTLDNPSVAGEYSFGGRTFVSTNANRMMDGRLADIRFYTGTVLTPAECKLLYNSAFETPVEPLLPVLFLPSGAPGVGVGSATGVGTAAAIGSSLASSQGAAAGAGSASAVGTGILLAQGQAAGTGVANGIAGATTSSAVGAAAGTGSAAAVGTGIKTSQGAAAGTGLAAAIGSATITSIGTSSGVGLAAGIAGGTFFGAASGVGTAQAFGLATIAAPGAAAGTGTAQAFGLASITAIGAATGVGQAQAFQFVPVSSAAGSASGFGIAIGIGGFFRAPPVAPSPYPSKHDYGWYDRMPPVRGKGRR